MRKLSGLACSPTEETDNEENAIDDELFNHDQQVLADARVVEAATNVRRHVSSSTPSHIFLPSLEGALSSVDGSGRVGLAPSASSHKTSLRSSVRSVLTKVA